MKYLIKRTNLFKREYKRLSKGKYNMSLLDDIILQLQRGEKLPDDAKDHPLHGLYEGNKECHIKDDWILVYRISIEHSTLTLVRTGTHTNIFDGNRKI